MERIEDLWLAAGDISIKRRTTCVAEYQLLPHDWVSQTNSGDQRDGYRLKQLPQHLVGYAFSLVNQCGSILTSAIFIVCRAQAVCPLIIYRPNQTGSDYFSLLRSFSLELFYDSVASFENSTCTTLKLSVVHVENRCLSPVIAENLTFSIFIESWVRY